MRTKSDLERIRVEILGRLSLLVESEPDPKKRERKRGDLQVLKAQLLELNTIANDFTTRHSQEELSYTNFIDPVSKYTMEADVSPGGGYNASLIGRLNALGCDDDQLRTGNFRPSDDALDRLAEKIEEIRGRTDEKSQWYDVEIIASFDEALEAAGGTHNNQQDIRDAVLALGPRMWIIIVSDK